MAGPAPATSRDATVSLVMGILGVVLCPVVCAPIALVYGRRARREIATTGAGGDAMATAGVVLGWVGVVLAVLTVLVVLLFATGGGLLDPRPEPR